jgi:hypothetical protein
MNTKKFYYSVLFALVTLAFNVNGQTTPSTTTDKTQQAEKPEFKPSGNVWGYTFGDYYYKMHSATPYFNGNSQYAGTGFPKDFNAFDLRRVYLGYDYNISENFSTQLLLADEGDNSTLDAAGERTFYLKLANIHWKNFIHNNELVIGQCTTPGFAMMSEGIWGYRNIEKTISDMRGIGKSNDLGISLLGKIDDAGNYGYNLMIGNGTSQKPENNKYKRFYGEVYGKFMDQKLIVDLYGDEETSSTTQSKATFKGFVAYQTTPITVGLELVYQDQVQQATDSINGVKSKVDVTPFGISIFAHGAIIKEKLNWFARYDNYNPDSKYDANASYLGSAPTNYKENFITAGLDWTPNKKVHIEPNIWYDGYSSMKNGVSGDSKSNYDMAPRLTFYYIFK